MLLPLLLLLLPLPLLPLPLPLLPLPLPLPLLLLSPPGRKFEKNHLINRSRQAIPRPFQPPPPHTIVDCGVVEVGGWAVRCNSPA